jgi:protein-disulfide isomerase
MSKQFLGVVVVVILIFVGIIALSGGKTAAPSGKTGSSNTLTQHIEGQGQSKVTLVEYGDYECPYCGQYYPIVKQVAAEFNQQIYFQFRNFPLTSVHPNAFAGARAAEAAALQNKFWQMHDLLYENQNQWSTASNPSTFFNQYAQQIGLNVTQFQTDFASSTVNDLINADEAQGTKLGVAGTPTFYLDDKQINAANIGDFEKLIKAEIAKKAVTSAGSPAATTPTTTPTTGQTSQTPAH